MSKTLTLSIAALFIGFSGMAAAESNVAVSTATTAALVGGSIAVEEGDTSHNTIGNAAFHAVEGVNQVQQNNGANNAMQQGAAVAVNRDDDKSQPLNLSLAVASNVGGSVGNGSIVSGNTSGNAISGDSFQNSAGINQVQQNNGNNNAMQQGAAVAVNQDADDTAELILPPAIALAVGASAGNIAGTSGSQQSNSISDHAFKNADGVNQVQQNNGSNNAMQQSAAVAVNENTSTFNVALAVTDLQAVVGLNTSVEADNCRTNEIGGSAFSHVSGISQVQQNSGNNSVMQQTVAVSVNGGF